MSSTTVEKAFTVEKDDDFDLQRYAHRVMEGAKQSLIEDKFLQAFAFLICDSQVVGYTVGFQGYEQKSNVYAEVVAIARELNATAIVTLNDVRTATLETVKPEEYYQGKLEEIGAPESIMVSVSGPNIPTWRLNLPYERANGEISFGELELDTEFILNLLPGWTFEENRVT
jgi:hypothetical protein